MGSQNYYPPPDGSAPPAFSPEYSAPPPDFVPSAAPYRQELANLDDIYPTPARLSHRDNYGITNLRTPTALGNTLIVNGWPNADAFEREFEKPVSCCGDDNCEDPKRHYARDLINYDEHLSPEATRIANMFLERAMIYGTIKKTGHWCIVKGLLIFILLALVILLVFTFAGGPYTIDGVFFVGLAPFGFLLLYCSLYQSLASCRKTQIDEQMDDYRRWMEQSHSGNPDGVSDFPKL
jgi:hypothetical protein